MRITRDDDGLRFVGECGNRKGFGAVDIECLRCGRRIDPHAEGRDIGPECAGCCTRIINEAIEGAPDALPTQTRQLISEPANGIRTVLHYLDFANERYLERACFTATKDEPPAKCL